MSDPFYITTAISYPNGRPHIGHAYEAIAVDAIARFQRLAGRDVRFVTGTDEHGLKMVQTAAKVGVPTRALADEMSGYFKEMSAKLNISYDTFVRTTEPRHYEASIKLWKAMEASGDLYLDRYEGWYSVRDEAFYDEKELVDGEGGVRLSPQGTPVEWTTEETWFFRLSRYQDALLKLYADNPDFIRPESRRNEVLRFVEGGLKDLSVSRTSFDWGVPVPNSPGHVMYVWVDALTTYMTGVGYGQDEAEYGRYWPADIHMIGKDIVRFHTVYWPAFLMSAGLPLPKQVFGHGFVLARGGEKMSKSAGNSADPLDLAERYGVDQLRYFLLSEIIFGQDGSYSEEAIVTRCNADLANNFGNLTQRVLSMIAKNLDGKLPPMEMAGDVVIYELVKATATVAFPRAFSELGLSNAILGWTRSASECNRYMDTMAPWTLKKTDPEAMAKVLATLFICIHDLAITIQPVVPEAAGRILDQMGIPENERCYRNALDTTWYDRLVQSDFRVVSPTGVFPRLEMPAATD